MTPIVTRIGSAIDRAMENGETFVVPNRTVWVLSGEIIYRTATAETLRYYENWIEGLTPEALETATTLARDWYGTMEDLIETVEGLR